MQSFCIIGTQWRHKSINSSAASWQWKITISSRAYHERSGSYTCDLKSKQPAKSLETTNVNEIFQFCCALLPKLAEQGANYHVLSWFLGAEAAPQRREAHNALARRVALKNCICRERSSLAIWQRCILRRWIIGAGEDQEVVVCVFLLP